MKSIRVVLAALLVVALGGAFDSVYAAWPNDPGINVRIAPSAYDQWSAMVVEDGAGGAFFVWSERYDVYAQHLTAEGLVAPGWPAGGIPVTAAPGPQYCTSVVSDGAGGFLAAWDDYRGGSISQVFVQRIAADGAPVWTPDGVPVGATSAGQHNARACPDRTGGAIVVWMDARDQATNGYDQYAQRISSTGTPLWTATGVPICTAVDDQDWSSVVSDGTAGGAYFCWRDRRSGVDYDLYASRLDRNGYLRSGWTTNGNDLSVWGGDQNYPVMVADGAFGAIVAWVDSRSGSNDIYGARLYSSGATAPGWPSGGLALTNDVDNQWGAALAADGAGGAIVAWQDSRVTSDIFAQRVGNAGVPAWTAGGIRLTDGPAEEYGPQVVSDGAGGAVVGWFDTRSGYPPLIYAQRVTGIGAIASGFSTSGNAIATAHWVQGLAMCSDGAGGAMLTWQDNAVPAADYAQRIDRWGYLGAQARIAGVMDVPNDQGGRVKVSWDRSPIDAWPENAIASYLVYRSVPPQTALEALARGEAVLGEAAASARSRPALLASEFAGATYYWEYLATVAAGQLPGYSYLAATAEDSVAGSNPRTLFMIRAEDPNGTRFWLSDPDSGYSTDDLAPAAPAPFAGAYSAGATRLHWGASTEADFAHYRIYRGATAGFVPGPGNLITSQPDTGYADVGAAGAYYRLSAVDAHGNESPTTLLTPSGTLDVVESRPAWTLALAPAFPNPFARTTTCRFTLPAEGHVRMTVHDAAGRLVRVLADRRMPAGEHAVQWRGEDELGGRSASGLYFARLTFAGRTLMGKIVRVE